MIFFFKQKTAYEMRMSDWSSDVCSSDLGIEAERVRRESAAGDEDVGLGLHQPEELAEQHRRAESDDLAATLEVEARPDEQARAERQADRARPEARERRKDERPENGKGAWRERRGPSG